MEVNREILEGLKTDKQLRQKLAKKMKKSEHTIYMWMWGNSDNLTKADALQCISDHTGIAIEVLISNNLPCEQTR